MKFGKHEVEEKQHPSFDDGSQCIIFFPNGYGASIVKFRASLGFGGSYGVEQGLWEMAVLRGDASKSNLTYSTPITDDVIGHLTEDEVGAYLDQVQSLESTVKRDEND